VLIIGYSVTEMLINDQANQLLYRLIFGAPQLILPLVLVILFFHLIISQTRLRHYNILISLLILALISILVTLTGLTLVDRLPKNDLIFIIQFFTAISLSYYLVKRALRIRTNG